MAKKQTGASRSLNPFNESLVKIISASVNYHSNGRSVLTRTFRSIDGSEHTFNANISSEMAFKVIQDAMQHIEDPLLTIGRSE